MKNFLLLIVFGLSLTCQAQFTVSGKIVDNDKKPLESATIYLLRVADSSIINYSISDTKGQFNLALKKQNIPTRLKISYIGFQTYAKDFEEINQSVNLGELILEENMLEGITIKGEAPPITIKKDTLEFNASSFKVNPDANVEALLKQLPGVEIDDEGKITVNGKPVNNILVNGKPFFGKDGKIATKNLPSNIIDKVQVSDTKTKQEELSGESSSSNESTINLTLQEDKNKGLFGKATAGYGTDKRYESSLLINHFKDKQKLNVLASSNNINSVGFSMDEIFDNMGGGRSRSISYSDNGTFSLNDLRFGSDEGITRSNMVGVNYTDSLKKDKIEPYVGYYFSNAITENDNKTKQINFLPTGNTNSTSTRNYLNETLGHNFNSEFTFKIDSTSTLFINPNFSKNFGNNRSNSERTTFDDNNNLLNKNDVNSITEDDRFLFKNELTYSKNFKRKGRFFQLRFNNENRENENRLKTINNATFFINSTTDNRNQSIDDFKKENKYSLGIEYGEPLTDSLKIGFRTTFDWQNQINQHITNDFNPLTSNYDLNNSLFSFNTWSNESTFNNAVFVSYQKRKARLRITSGVDVMKYNHNSRYLNNIDDLNKDYVFPNLNISFSQNFTQSKSIWTSLRYKANLPRANQLLPFENLINPVQAFVGNEQLKPEEKYTLYFNFNDYDWQTRAGKYIYGGGEITKNQIINSTVFDESFRAITTYDNANIGSWSYLGFGLSKSHKKEKRTIRYSYGVDINHNYNQGLTNNDLFSSHAYSIRPRFSFNWTIEDKISMAPSYNFSHNVSFFNNYILDKTLNNRHNAKVEITTYWPKNLVIGHDFGYIYNSAIADGFRKDFLLWNLSVGYNFYKDQFLAKIKVYDLLDQNLNARRTITPTAIVDAENTILQQYVMFSLTYKFSKFGGKEKKNNRFFID